MRWTLAIAAIAACGDGGTGANLETVATLPAADRYTIGFEADGTPLLGFLDTHELLRFDGEGWAPHAVTTPFRVAGFGLDLDGAPLVLHQLATRIIQVNRLEPSGAAVQLGDLVEGRFDGVFQHVSGSRFLIGDSTFVLRPGATTWERSPTTLFGVQRGPDGRLYAHSFSGLVRLEPNDTTTLVADCSVGSCSTPQFGIDARGRFYFDQTDAVTVFDETQGAIASVKLPDGQLVHSLALTEGQSLVVGHTIGGGRGVFALGGEETGFAILPMHAPHPLSSQEVTLHLDPAGTIYIAQGDWLGRVAAAP